MITPQDPDTGKGVGMKTKTFYAETPGRLAHHLEAALSDGFRPGLALVFASVFHDMDAVRQPFADQGIEVFGASTAGEIVNREVLEETIAVMLLDLPDGAFTSALFQVEELGPERLGHRVADWATGFHDDPAILMMISSGMLGGETVVADILDRAGEHTALFGCLAAYDPAIPSENPRTWVFSREAASTEALVALAFNPDIVTVRGTAVSGWKGIGTPKTLTRVSGNTVHTIDDMPALDVINRYLRIGDDPDLAMEYPLLWEREDDAWVMRVIIDINPDKSIVLSGAFPENAKVRFGMSPGVDIISYATERLKAFKSENELGEALILFSCRARHMSLGNMISEEVAAVQSIWNLPAVGAFTFGEIGPGQSGACEFHNHTLVPVLIGW